ncbi:hypothetical protein WJX75_008930 [Coccomyxa subellipsoidea]|uniref:Uncharacterized protein n=1 Tax=Coccomyxa subellipsoidea TaxID=248742 RepID=A0ABR2YFM7_9CHLO
MPRLERAGQGLALLRYQINLHYEAHVLGQAPPAAAFLCSFRSRPSVEGHLVDARADAAGQPLEERLDRVDLS